MIDVPQNLHQLNKTNLTFDRCALCAKSSDLQASHIIPRFVFNWLKNTSATGHFRSSENPNLRVQDGLKPRMLCMECEQLFSSWEKQFSEECFVLLNRGNVHNISYGPWMLKFATSVSWRVLHFFDANGYLSKFPDHIITSINRALREWSQFLLDDSPHPGSHEQHMFLGDVIAGTSIANTPANISRYLARTIDCDVAFTQDSAITYAKMGKFVLFGFIEIPHPRQWEGTKLHVRKGSFGEKNIELPSTVGEYLFDRAMRAANSNSKISTRQRARISKSYKQNLDRAVQSETLRALHQDVLLFGNKAFEITQPESGELEIKEII